MSMFELASGSRYVKVVFDSRELGAIKAACAFVSAKEHDKLGGMTAAELEQAARQAKKASEYEMADRLVSLFRPGQEILVEQEDLEPVLDSLKAYSGSAPEEHAQALKSALKKIESASAKARGAG